MRRPQLRYVLLLSFVCIVFLLLRDDQIRNISFPDKDKHEKEESLYECIETPANASTSPRECDAVHVLLLCEASAVAREIGLLAKSLIFHRRVPLHLHFISDETCTMILQTLFDTWDIHHFEVSFYKSESQGVDKLLSRAHTYLPQTVKQVIYLRHNIRILSDVNQLWCDFEKFTENQFIGMFRDEGTTIKKPNFYDDILLLHLEKIRKSDNLSEHLQRFLSSEKNDIFKGMFMLPCSIRLDIHSVSQCDSCKAGNPAGTIAWGSKRDEFMRNASDKDIRWRMRVLLQTSSHQVSRDIPMCSIRDLVHKMESELQQNQTASSAYCDIYRSVSKLKRRTHLYYIGAPLKEPTKDKYDISLLTQLTLDRFSVFEKFMNNWEGPAAVVFQVSEMDALRLPEKVEGSKILINRTNIAYHIVYEREVYYPINYLRNVALNQTKTPYTLLVDVDLVPSPGIYTRLKELVAETASKRMMALVVPAFEALKELESFPENKKAILEHMKNNTIDGYKMYRAWNLGHKPTNYEQWKTADSIYQVKWKDAYEPYVVIRTDKNMPRYHEFLLDRMADKIAYARELHARGYEFWVIPDVFAIHLPHPLSVGSEIMKSDRKYYGCSKRLFDEFRKRLKKTHPDKHF